MGRVLSLGDLDWHCRSRGRLRNGGYRELGYRARVDDLTALIADWPVDRAAVGVATADGVLGVAGDRRWVTRVASVSKILVGQASLVALEEETIELDEPAGPEGSTVRHLLAHASGLSFSEHIPLAAPGRRRVYSNVGIELFADHLARKAEMPFERYLHTGVLEPLAMRSTLLLGSPAHDVHSTVDDLLVFGRELLAPHLIDPSTLDMATRAHFPELRGVVPAVGSFDPCPWGLTFEIRGSKDPHWTGRLNSARTFGHFGGSGCFLWVDPEVGLVSVGLTTRQFGAWALDAWPRFSDAVLSRYAGVSAGDRTTP
jgi:CubicO group peptidase (beta-lactamase class C family)